MNYTCAQDRVLKQSESRNIAKLVLLAILAIIVGWAVQPSVTHAFSVNASTEAELRTHLANYTAETSGTHTINLTSGITIANVLGDTSFKVTNGSLSAPSLIINGNGNFLSGGGSAGSRKSPVIRILDRADVTFNDLIIKDTFVNNESAVVVADTNVRVRFDRCTFSGNDGGGTAGALTTSSGSIGQLNVFR